LLVATVAVAVHAVAFEAVVGFDSVSASNCLLVPVEFVTVPPPLIALAPTAHVAVAVKDDPLAELPAMATGAPVTNVVVPC
jgi:hypothetical protein